MVSSRPRSMNWSLRCCHLAGLNHSKFPLLVVPPGNETGIRAKKREGGFAREKVQ